MPLTIIEINDYQLTVRQQHSHYSELGFAQITKDSVIFGEEAWLQARISPHANYCHYWQRLGYEEIHCDNNYINNFADLAYRQLQNMVSHLQQCSDVIFVVPTSYSQEQLSLLLGIGQSCQLNVLGIVNKALVRFEHVYDVGKYAILDISLHHCSVNELLVNHDISLGSIEQFSHKGFNDLYEQLAQWLNHQLITEHRLDAFYSATTEQQIYNQLSALIKNPQRYFELIIDDKCINVAQKDINQQIEAFFTELLASCSKRRDKNIPLFITARFANLCPHLFASETVQVLNDACIYSLVTANIANLSNDNGVFLVTRLPLVKGTTSQPEAAKQSINNSLANNHDISHILLDGRAFPLNGHSLYLSCLQKGIIAPLADQSAAIVLEPKAGAWQLNLTNAQLTKTHFTNTQKVFLNEQLAIDGQIVAQGDQITIKQTDGENKAHFVLIKVEQEV
ncbi:MAG: hypothetical protein JKX90_05230 [Colwellia sp.]|nr:hypothetical protein [Colwellia sp.]